MNIVGGSHFIENNNRVYNVAHLFRRDGTIEQQYKLHISPNERRWWGINGGSSMEVFETDCGSDGIAGECSENTETVIMAEVDMETLERYRKSNDTLSFRDRRTDLYSLCVRS